MALLNKDNPHAADLVEELQKADTTDQVNAVINRSPAAGMFDWFLQVGDHKVRYRFGREPNGDPADRWGWDDLE
ncbi:hypothetical protein [Nocardia salmonicida]|uniref:hypothetical protein n=1 Tax=Nocardia salmonicida TaxID=53431 RepID=UPI003CF8BBF3